MYTRGTKNNSFFQQNVNDDNQYANYVVIPNPAFNLDLPQENQQADDHHLPNDESSSKKLKRTT